MISNKNNISLYILLFIFFICNFIPRSCNSSEIKTEVIIPEISGKFDTVKPVEIKTNKEYVYITKYKTKIITSYKNNDSLIKQFERANDSTKINLFIEKTKIRQYNEVFENDTIQLSIFTETAGELLKMTPSYIIKERKQEITIKQKQSVFALYGGLKLVNNLKLANPNIEGNLGFQNKKGAILEVGYDINKNISIGYKYRILNIQK